MNPFIPGWRIQDFYIKLGNVIINMFHQNCLFYHQQIPKALSGYYFLAKNYVELVHMISTHHTPDVRIDRHGG